LDFSLLTCPKDLKPDNIGFTSDGQLKVFDFGLIAIVKRRESLSTEAYEMTGKTGSPRYMAPEVMADTKTSVLGPSYNTC
jgi:serine/threonine protein kinase